MNLWQLSPRKMMLLGSLYFAQGLPFGFFYQALPVLMRERDYSLVAIGLSSLLAAPWGLKFLWAPLIDRYGSPRYGRRRTFIIPLQIMSAALLFLIAAYGTERDLGAVLMFVFAVNLFASTQDIATDGLALDVLAPDERGAANGIQVAGFRVGMVMGGGVLLMLVGPWGWSATFASMGLMMLLTTVPVILHREVPSIQSPQSIQRIATSLLRRPGILGWLLVVVSYKFGHHLAQGMLRPYLVDFGANREDIGLVLGVIGSTAGLIGALLGGIVVHQLGRRRALWSVGLAQAVAVAGYAVTVPFGATLTSVAVVSTVEHLVSGMGTVALFTAMMDACEEESAATDYTIQASLVVFATAGANVVGGFTATAFGWLGHFVFAAAVCAGAAAVARAIKPAPATAVV